MGGEIQWAALPWMAAHVGCEDLDVLIHLLTVIRANNAKRLETSTGE